MKVVSWEHLVDSDLGTDSGRYTDSAAFQLVMEQILVAIRGTVWPPGSDRFTIHAESGRLRGMGNGVKPIKDGFISTLRRSGWTLEARAPRLASSPANLSAKGSRPGAFDCHFVFHRHERDPFVVEWETGNVSSSHRAVNRIGLGILSGYISGGVLILPSLRLARYLTDRIGNEPELRPYHPLWRRWDFANPSYFGIVAVEQDAESLDVQRIPKGTDGRSAN